VTLLLNILLGIIITRITVWGVGALYFSPLLPAELRRFAAASYGAATLLAFALLPWPGGTAIAALAIFAILVILFLRIPASNDRDWQPEVAFTPHAKINGDIVMIHGVRNFDYRTETDFTPRWEVRTYDLRKLDSADIIAAYWMEKSIAHVMLISVLRAKTILRYPLRPAKKKARAIRPSLAFFATTSFIT
jgi:hypothetical protein